jgi:putative ABC transport system substrate-binding protein
MRPVGRRVVAGMVAVLVVAAGGCSKDDPPVTRTIAVLRAAPGSSVNEDQLLAGLRAGGYPTARLRVLGADPSEVHATEEDAVAAVRAWKGAGAELIFALSTSGAKAAAEAAPDLPVIFLSTDPKGTGLVENLRRPEGRLTGSSYRVPSDRVLLVAGDALGDLHRIGCLFAADDPAAAPARDDLLAGADSLDIDVTCVSFHAGDDAPAAARDVLAAGVDAVVLVSSPTLVRVLPQLAPVLSVGTVPVISTTPVDLAVLSLEPDGADVYRQLGGQAARVLDGTPMAKIPVQDPGRYLLVINATVAERIGRTIPADVLERADKVIR